MKQKLSPQDWQLLSSYLDGQVSARQKEKLENRLEKSPELREGLEKLSRTRSFLRMAPRRRSPRNFSLTPQMLQSRKPSTPFFSFFSFASAISAILLIVLILVDLLPGQKRTLQSAPDTASITMQENAAMVQEEDMVEIYAAEAIKETTTEPATFSIEEMNDTQFPPGEEGLGGVPAPSGEIYAPEVPAMEEMGSATDMSMPQQAPTASPYPAGKENPPRALATEDMPFPSPSPASMFAASNAASEESQAQEQANHAPLPVEPLASEPAPVQSPPVNSLQIAQIIVAILTIVLGFATWYFKQKSL